jgi:tetratricopeptide (TPR) repeat protein
MNEEPAEAFEQFYQAALSDPDNEFAGFGCRAPADPEQAGRESRGLAIQGRRLGPIHPACPMHGLVWPMRQSGKTDLAIAANRNAIKKTPRALQAYQNLSKIYLQNGQTKAGLEILDAAAKQSNLDAAFLINLAETFADYGQLRKEESDFVKPRVIDALNRASELKPENPLLLEKLADGYKLMHETQKAVKFYEQILEQEPINQLCARS